MALALRPAVAALLLAAALPARGGPACPLPPPGAVALLGAPPAAGSPAAAADLDAVLAAQRDRTAGDVARARAEEVLTVEDFAAVLGSGVAPAGLPATDALLARAAEAVRPCIAEAKRTFTRPRPFAADPRVEPAVEREPTASYPSGHATRGALFAALLADLAPSRRGPLHLRGAQIGADRVVGGVHYPTDVAAGARLGAAVAEALLADPAFRAVLDDVRAREWASPAAPPAR